MCFDGVAVNVGYGNHGDAFDAIRLAHPNLCVVGCEVQAVKRLGLRRFLLFEAAFDVAKDIGLHPLAAHDRVLLDERNGVVRQPSTPQGQRQMCRA